MKHATLHRLTLYVIAARTEKSRTDMLVVRDEATDQIHVFSRDKAIQELEDGEIRILLTNGKELNLVYADGQAYLRADRNELSEDSFDETPCYSAHPRHLM